VRIELFGDEVERLSRFDVMTGELLGDLEELLIFPATHYVAGDERTRQAIASIEVELGERLRELDQAGKLLESPTVADAHRARSRDARRARQLQRGRELQPSP